MEEMINIHPTLGKKPKMVLEHSYSGFGNCHSECTIKIWDLDDNRVLVVFLDKGIGTSVTNFAEKLVESTYKDWFSGRSKDEIIWAETYPYVEEDQTFDQIIPEWDGDSVTRVSWKFLAEIVK